MENRERNTLVRGGGDDSFRNVYCCCSPRRHSVTLVFSINIDRLSDILKITETACTLDGRVINKLRFAYDLVMLSHSGKGI